MLERALRWLGLVRVPDALREASRWERESSRLLARLARDGEALGRLAGQVRSAVDEAASRVAEAERLQRLHETALEQLRAENRVLETTVQALVAQHRLMLERIDAETAIEVRRQVAAIPREE